MILDKARELGLALSETEEFKGMLCARINLEQNEAVCAQLDEFKDKQEALMTLLSGEDPDRLTVAELSREVETLQEDLLQNELFSNVMQAQNAFQTLMNEVNREIAACIGLEAEESGGCACGDGCSSCSGCKH